MKTAGLSLSVIILTHRSDNRFIKALASAQPANEVLIIDFGSKNNWPQLKKQFHFTLITHQGPIRNFSAERNAALKQAKYEWVFFLDSDEVIQANSWQAINKTIQNERLTGVLVRRLDVFYGRTLRFGETGGVWLLRMMKKNAGQFVRPVHEIAQVTGRVQQSAITLQHFAHTSIAEFLQSITQYARIEAEYQTDKQLPIFWLGIKTIAYPKGKFLVNYFFKLGWLDGWRGLVYAVMMSLHSIFVRVFAYENR